MDYNDYEIEREVFRAVDSPDGPILEYDRQALSAIYNSAKDVKSTDPVLPVCNDAEADRENGGSVDPLCLRYDLEKDPTGSIETALRRLRQPEIEGDVSLPSAIENLVDDAISVDRVRALTNREGIEEFISSFSKSLVGVVNFYLAGGKSSLMKTIRSNQKSLYGFEKGILPAEYSESGMRLRLELGLKSIFTLQNLPEPSKKAVNQAIEKALDGLRSAPGFSALGSVGLKAVTEGLKKSVHEGVRDSLKRTRLGVIGLLRVKEGTPFFFGTLSHHPFDFERLITSELTKIIQDATRDSEERILSATGLMTYAGRSVGPSTLEGLKKRIRGEILHAKTTESREVAIKIDQVLRGQQE
jgi:hypothetical protein